MWLLMRTLTSCKHTPLDPKPGKLPNTFVLFCESSAINPDYTRVCPTDAGELVVKCLNPDRSS